jgi:long-chain fatty acid transport protein
MTAFEAALAEDPVTVFYKPAGATRLPGTQLSVGGQLVLFKVDFEDHGSTVNPRLGGGALRGERNVNGGEIGSTVPALFATHRLTSPRW